MWDLRGGLLYALGMDAPTTFIESKAKTKVISNSKTNSTSYSINGKTVRIDPVIKPKGEIEKVTHPQ